MWAPERVGYVVAMYRLSRSLACRILVPWPGIKPAFPALQGRFLTTEPPGSPFFQFLKKVPLGSELDCLDSPSSDSQWLSAGFKLVLHMGDSSNPHQLLMKFIWCSFFHREVNGASERFSHLSEAWLWRSGGGRVWMDSIWPYESSSVLTGPQSPTPISLPMMGSCHERQGKTSL